MLESVTVSARSFGKITWWAFVLVGLVICGLVLWRQKELNIVYADDQPLIVETVTTKAAQEKGLSGRTGVQKGHGMLFVFDGPVSQSCIWMKDMRMDIDAYWFDRQGHLLTARTQLTPASFPTLYCPDLPASYLLEVPTGQFTTAPTQLALPIYQ